MNDRAEERGEAFIEAECGAVRYAWRSPAAATGGTVVLLPGRGEFIEKYEEILEHFEQEGYAVACLDWRGQGASCRLLAANAKGHVARFEDYLDDLARLLERLDAMRLPAPWLMLGHSMGGHIGLRYLAEREHPFAAAALVAPMFDIDFGMLPRPFASAISRMCMRLGLGQRYAPGQRDPAFLRCGFEGNRLTSCPERFAAWRQLLERHPEKVIGGVTFGWLDASLRSIQQTRRPGYLEAVDTPLLVCRAGQERIVCNRAVQEFVARLPRASLIDVEEARHDLFWERTDTRLRVIDRISGFFRDSARAAKQRSQAA